MLAAAACGPPGHVMIDPLPVLSTVELETLLAALDPLLDGFGDGASCLDDARAFLNRLAEAPETEGARPAGAQPAGQPLLRWLDAWRDAGGNRATLRLMVVTLLEERRNGDD
jgi:hypothetical protein